LIFKQLFFFVYKPFRACRSR